ncbi:putative Acyltransferase family protein [Vibrio nigripulchritudo SOn1]|uniref:Acyltransferase family protein n=1 Tax=Vibrio nigripulchritudo SOn1 TaxID=1238450 RepID=A0AAV2VHJ1_9VIBR|nr:acyltransferase family protein [Vibrio nigripulchritudo]CCO44165.1 putative Acyltransferase family protein [Vibrio nigripulchritudo SOn1]
MSLVHSNKIASLELGRLIAMFAIIFLHSQSLNHPNASDAVIWTGYALNQLSRFAVPFFFLLSGFLIQPKLSRDPFTTLKNYSLPLIQVWLVWSVICLLMPFNWHAFLTNGYIAERSGYWEWLLQNPLNTFFEGGLVHLWFIPGLLCAVAIIAVGVRFNWTRGLILIAGGLYVFGVLAGSYREVTGIEFPIFTRNGPFFSTLMVLIGFEIRRLNLTMNIQSAIIVALVGLSLHMGEAEILTAYGTPFNTHDFLAGTPIWATGLFFILLANPDWGRREWVMSLSKLVLGIYVAHLPIQILVDNLVRFAGLEAFTRDFVLVSGTLICSVLFVWSLSKTPLKKVLFR